jgi:hypothetical protein
MDVSASSVADGDVTCDALRLALVATHLRTVWHAGVIDPETAMTRLDSAIRDIARRRYGTATGCSNRGL